MPYINQKDRNLIDGSSDFTARSGLDSFLYKMELLRGANTPEVNKVATHPGTLNYIITRICLWWLRCRLRPVGSDWRSYQNFNEVIGVLECVKQELYRRHVAPYEDEKCEENGDV